MISTTNITSEQLNTSMHNALMDKIRDALRDKILERIKPDLDEAIDAAVETMKASIGQFYDSYKGEHMVKIIVERKNKI